MTTYLGIALAWRGLLRPRQTQSALSWGDGDADVAGVDSDSDNEEGSGGAANKERKEVEAAKEAAEEEARETAEEKRLRLARDVLMKLDAEQRENVRLLFWPQAGRCFPLGGQTEMSNHSVWSDYVRECVAVLYCPILLYYKV